MQLEKECQRSIHLTTVPNRIDTPKRQINDKAGAFIIGPWCIHECSRLIVPVELKHPISFIFDRSEIILPCLPHRDQESVAVIS